MYNEKILIKFFLTLLDQPLKSVYKRGGIKTILSIGCFTLKTCKAVLLVCFHSTYVHILYVSYIPPGVTCLFGDVTDNPIRDFKESVSIGALKD